VKEALNAFEGEHDFLYFHKTGSPVHTTVRTLYKSRYYRMGDTHIITFEANGFLRSQVRLMVEAALQYAQKKIGLHALCSQIDCKTRSITRPAPPQGLYLAKIFY
jgi:tRNA pseudouridine38-40 synthase